MKAVIFVLALVSSALAAPQPNLDERATATYQPIPTFTYQSCGGHVVSPVSCPKGQICVDNPRTCSQAVDCPGICVTPRACGGFAGIKCPLGKKCYDDPRDDCDPLAGGADCIGICI